MKIEVLTIKEAWIAPNDNTRVNYVLNNGFQNLEMQTPIGSRLGQALLKEIDRAKALELAASRGQKVPDAADWRQARSRRSFPGHSGNYGRPLFRSPVERDEDDRAEVLEGVRQESLSATEWD